MLFVNMILWFIILVVNLGGVFFNVFLIDFIIVFIVFFNVFVIFFGWISIVFGKLFIKLWLWIFIGLIFFGLFVELIFNFNVLVVFLLIIKL